MSATNFFTDFVAGSNGHFKCRRGKCNQEPQNTEARPQYVHVVDSVQITAHTVWSTTVANTTKATCRLAKTELPSTLVLQLHLKNGSSGHSRRMTCSTKRTSLMEC